MFKKAAFAAVWPDEIFDEKRLGYTQGYLQKTIFEWLKWKELTADEAKNQVHLVRALRKRDLDTAFQKEWTASLGRAERQPLRHVAHFKRRSQLFLEYIESAKRARRSDELHFQEMTDALTTHTVADLLRHGCSLWSHRSVSGREVGFPLLEAVLATLERQPALLAEPVVAAYFQVYQSLAQPDSEASFWELKTLLAAHWQLFPADESRDLCLFAINFCIKRVNSGQKQFIREAFELYQFGLENRLLLENGHLSPYAYNNILLIALNLGEAVWARDFLEKWKPFLPEKERENEWQHNLVQFFYRTGDLENAMMLLQKVEFREPLRFLESRRMLARIYHKLGEMAALDSLLDSLRIYLYRKNGLGYHRGSYLNFIKLMKKMLASDGSDRAALLREARETPALVEREWLVEVINDSMS